MALTYLPVAFPEASCQCEPYQTVWRIEFVQSFGKLWTEVLAK